MIWTYATFTVKCSRNISTNFMVIFGLFEQHNIQNHECRLHLGSHWELSIIATQYGSTKFIKFYCYGLLIFTNFVDTYHVAIRLDLNLTINEVLNCDFEFHLVETPWRWPYNWLTQLATP
jgi:hypothetical protein